MKNFMVVCKTDGKQWASFFDTLEEAESYRMNCECGCGGYAEVYRYEDETTSDCSAYVFLYS